MIHTIVVRSLTTITTITTTSKTILLLYNYYDNIYIIIIINCVCWPNLPLESGRVYRRTTFRDLVSYE